jgi:hypothetical protein
MNPRQRFAHDTAFLASRLRGSPALHMLLDGRLDDEALAMVTLQMFHYVRHTVAITEYALSKLPALPEHDPFRRLLEHLAEDEAGHELVALEDLARLGYDPERCRQTLPLPTTFNLPAENRFGVDELGPYYLLGECHASETLGAELATRIHDAYARRPTLAGGLAFYALHGASDVRHARAAEACFERYIDDPALYRPILMGYLTATRNLVLLGAEVAAFRSYPACFQLPRRHDGE